MKRGVPVIIFSRISALGEEIDVFPISALPGNYKDYIDVRDSSVSLTFLMPSLRADISVKSFFNTGNLRENYAASALAAVGFLVYIRGLPLDEVTVETPVGIFEVIRAERNAELGVLLRKCKFLCSKTLKYAKSIEICATEMLTKCGVVRIFVCPDADSFSAEALSVLSLGDDGENVSASVALSVHEGYAKMKLNRVNSDKESPLLDAILASASYIFEVYHRLEPIELRLLGVNYRVSLYGGELLVSAPISFMRFGTPYL